MTLGTHSGLRTQHSCRSRPMAQQSEQIAHNPALGAAAVRERGAPDAVARPDVRATPGFDRRAWRRYRRHKIGMVALGMFLVVVGFSLAAPLVSRYTGFTYTENHLADKLKA